MNYHATGPTTRVPDFTVKRAENVLPGDIVIRDGAYARVVKVVIYPPDTHPRSPIRNDLAAVELVTERGAIASGSRWMRRGFQVNVYTPDRPIG